jgi:hypothetical protein
MPGTGLAASRPVTRSLSAIAIRGQLRDCHWADPDGPLLVIADEIPEKLIVVTAPTITVKVKNATNHVGFSDRGGSTTMRS